MPVTVSPVVWTPQLQQDVAGPINYSDVYFNLTNEGGGTARYNVYSLRYSTVFKLIDGTYTIPVGNNIIDTTDVPQELINMRRTLIGVIPLINITSNHSRRPITYSFPSNNYAISVVSFNRYYEVIPQPSSDITNTPGIYSNVGATTIRLPYQNALVINGIYNSTGGFTYGQNTALFRMEIKQAAYTASGVGDDTTSYLEKKIVVPIEIIKAISDISVKPFTGTGKYTIQDADQNGVITREYVKGVFDLSFNEFATTTRKNVLDGTDDTTNIIYYLARNDVRDFIFTNEYLTISNNRIIFHKVTLLPDGTPAPISIRFLQEETPIYRRSSTLIGETSGSTRTIRINIIKSTPIFSNLPPDLNKMTSERNFVIALPTSNNTDPEAVFEIASSNPDLLQIRSTGTGATIVFTAYISGSGVVSITIKQPATTNFNEKSVSFNVNIFDITPSIINCNTNLFYTNPYNRQFWTRFKPECRSSNLVDSITGAKLSVSQVDEIYDMRRKAEILKYNKNVGGLTKNQKYAKASRGELMRKIGNENKYLSQASGGVGGSAGFGPFTLICPTVSANSRVLCGLTSACGVPGKERLLCYDASINLYNYKRTYQYQAGLQVTLNIPTTLLTEPTNLRIAAYDNILNKITLTWDAPDSNGGLPIVGYVITFSVDNKTWQPYKSVFPTKPAAGTVATYNPISGEINGNSVIFERIPNSSEIRENTTYYISVFSGNERGLSSVPATITVKTSSVPSIISDFGFTTPTDERQNLMIDIKWTDPLNSGTSPGSFNGPPIRQYNLYYRKVPTLTWTKIFLDVGSVIIDGSQSRRFILRNLENQNKYDVKIEPINNVGVGPESAIITGRTLMKPGAPMNVVATSKYGILPLVFTDESGNYISITWGKPDTGGSAIKLYNITITPPAGSPSVTTLTIPYPVSALDKSTTYVSNIGRLGLNALGPGTYSIVIEAFNGFLTSVESTRASVIINARSAKATIDDIVGNYTESGIQYADIIFTINDPVDDGITVELIKVNGLNTAFQTTLDIYNQRISGTGEHRIRVPALFGGRDVIIVGNTYSVTITVRYSSALEETSEIFQYIPEIRYLSL
jgi:hypothetical protein